MRQHTWDYKVNISDKHQPSGRRLEPIELQEWISQRIVPELSGNRGHVRFVAENKTLNRLVTVTTCRTMSPTGRFSAENLSSVHETTDGFPWAKDMEFPDWTRVSEHSLYQILMFSHEILVGQFAECKDIDAEERPTHHTPPEAEIRDPNKYEVFVQSNNIDRKVGKKELEQWVNTGQITELDKLPTNGRATLRVKSTSPQRYLVAMVSEEDAEEGTEIRTSITEKSAEVHLTKSFIWDSTSHAICHCKCQIMIWAMELLHGRLIQSANLTRRY